MSDTWDDDDYFDYHQEEYDNQLYEEFRSHYVSSSEFAQDVDREIEERFDDILQSRIEERLHGFYLANPDTVKPALALVEQSQALFNLGFYSPAQVFAGAATEVIFKRVLFFPIVHGFVPIDTVAQMVVDIFSKSIREIGKFKSLLIHVVALFSGIDVTTYKSLGSERTLWEEAGKVREQRNAFYTRGRRQLKSKQNNR